MATRRVRSAAEAGYATLKTIDPRAVQMHAPGVHYRSSRGDNTNMPAEARAVERYTQDTARLRTMLDAAKARSGSEEPPAGDGLGHPGGGR